MWRTTMYETTKLTVELRELIENGVDIWDFEYDSFYTGDDKKAFEQKVIDHFYFRQIGFETVGRFKHYFKTKIREIMPYYKEMYKSVKLMQELDNPFDNVDIVETYEEESEGTSSGSGTSESNASKNGSENTQHKFSNTPQGEISNIDRYMTEVSTDDRESDETVNSSGSSESNTSSSGKVSHTLTRKGNQGVNTYAHDIIEYRQSIINIDLMIINQLNELFLGVY